MALLNLTQRAGGSIGAHLFATTPQEGMIDLDRLVVDRRLQVRETLNETHIEDDLRPKIRDGERLPAITVGLYQNSHYVVGGFHRIEAFRREGHTRIMAELLPVATWRDLLALALPTNADHGLPLTRADRRRKVEMAITEYREEVERGDLSDQALAKLCKVSPSLVNEVRREMLDGIATTRTVERGGKTYTMHTEKIGRPRQAKPEELADLVTAYLDAVYADDPDGAVGILVAAEATPAVAQALAEQADLPTHTPGALTQALTQVANQRAITIRLAPPKAQALLALLRLHAPDLVDLVEPQVEGATWEV